MNSSNEITHDSRLVISYLTLRKLIGTLGFIFPWMLVIGGFLMNTTVQTSMSHYYHTGMRDIFVAILCTVAAFFLAYKGYDRKDAIAGNIAGICAIGVAMLPTTPEFDASNKQIIIGNFHFLFASGYFLTLAYFCLVLFTKTSKNTPTPRKLQRNLIYRISGYIILGSLILIAVYEYLLPDDIVAQISHLHPFFWLESLGIIAFGTSWLVKGEAILKD